jgi:cysteine desulfurase
VAWTSFISHVLPVGSVIFNIASKLIVIVIVQLEMVNWARSTFKFFMIYFDNNATTPVVPDVLDAMLPYLGLSYANASSGHSFGQESRNAVNKARQSVADLLGAGSENEIVFTSCGTESDNWAIFGSVKANPEKNHIITTRVEHEAVSKVCRNLELEDYLVTWLDVDEDGSLDIDVLREALDEKTAVVSVMLANNETGILFPVKEIGEIVKERSKALFHVDGVNAVGKIPIDLKNTEIDLFSVAAHKFYGPKGIGALYIREGIELPSFFIGGGQENGRRAGTPATHQIAGMSAAAEFVKDMSPLKHVGELRDRLENGILKNIPNSRLNGTSGLSKRLPNTSSISFENTNGEMIMHKLDELGICVSTGSACHSQDHKASAVLEAMNVPYSYAMGSIRFSLGRLNTETEVDTALSALPVIINELRELGGFFNTISR